MRAAKGESKADKTGGHKVFGVSPAGGVGPRQKRAVPPYTMVKPPVSPPSVSAGGVMSPAGTKALMFRARKELADVSTPDASITE